MAADDDLIASRGGIAIQLLHVVNDEQPLTARPYQLGIR